MTAPHPGSKRQREATLARRHWLIRNRRAILAVVSMVALGLLLALAFGARMSAVLPGDVGITLELQENHSPIVYAVLYAVSWVGYPPQTVIITAVLFLALLLARLRIEALFFLLALLADTLAGGVKLLIDRPRPSATLVQVAQRLSDNSFPSGHVVHYTVSFGFLLFILATRVRPSWWRMLLITVLAALIALVGISRIYLGAHWQTDVIGGYLLGGLCLMALIIGYRVTLKHLAKRRQQAASALS